MDINKVKARLASLTTTNTKTVSLWKPSPGASQIIRIIPYKHQPDNSFIELLFHFNVNNKTYLSPSTFGRPDPFVELAQMYKKKGDKENWKNGKRFEPKLRTYAPILVRGEENEGVKFWGFGKQVYQSILGIISDPDYGDITDPVTGRDITVSYIEAAGQDFAKTEIRVKPAQTPMTTDKSVLEKIKNTKNILDLFPELGYSELSDILKKFVNPDTEEVAEAVSEETEVTSEQSDVGASTPEKVDESVKSVSEEKSAVKSDNKIEDMAKEFDDLWNK